MRILFIICSLFLTVWVLSVIDADEVYNYIKNSDGSLVAYYAVLSCIGALVRAVRWFDILKFQGHSVRYVDVLSCTLIRNCTVDLLPARLGESALLFSLKSLKIPFKSGASALGGTFVLDGFVLLLIVVGVISGHVSGHIPILIVGFASFVLIVLLYLPDIFAKVPFTRVLTPSLLYLKNRALMVRLLVATLILRAAKYLSLFFLADAVIDAELPVAEVCLAFVSAEAAASLPASGFLGFGAYEAIWAGTASAVGLEVDDLVSKVFAIHVITQFWGVVLGVVGGWWLALVIFNERKKAGTNFRSNKRSSVNS